MEVGDKKTYIPDAPGGKPCNWGNITFQPSQVNCTNPQTWLVELYGDIHFSNADPLTDVPIYFIRLCDNCFNTPDKQGNYVYELKSWYKGETKPKDFKYTQITRLFTTEEILQEENA